ncbi:acid-sensing ion channel 4-B-like [Ixodes scapularis]|uniref:acid-sensing ion channel 4-B-like n=1 Tax=Ixodes scapularis TaxID=6945 RepID=UPI001A9F9A4B|nr:acid-sensing ion channel 4-B-like [Ixodes scapularis]
MRRSTVEAFRRMFSESGVPGLRVILGFSAPSRRLLWAAVLALLVGLGLHDLYAAFRDFAQYEDTVDVELSRLPEGLVFPAVTICNLNQLPEDEALDRKEFFKWVTEMQRRNAATAQLLGHQREDMVLSCRLDDRDCNDPQRMQLQMYGRYGNCFCVGCDRSAPEHRLQVSITVDQGLRLLLNVEPEEYLPLSVEAGFVVNVHQAGVQVDFRRDGVFVPPRHTTFVSVDQTILKRLEPPYMNPCQPSWPEEYLQHTRPGRDVYTSRVSLPLRLDSA